MKRAIDADHSIIFTQFFPSKYADSCKRYRVLVGVGGNLGNVKRTFDKLFLRLKDDRYIDIVKSSPIFVNPDFASKDTPRFFNAVVLVATNLTPMALLEKLARIEKRFGRKRSYKNAPRTLDLDIIFFESKTIYNERLSLPHPHWHKRKSVLVPMALL